MPIILRSTTSKMTRYVGFFCRTSVAFGVKPRNLKASGPVNVMAIAEAVVCCLDTRDVRILM